MNIRLEYSPIEGKFNQAQATDHIQIAKGYKTLCCFVNAERASRFTNAIINKYPELNSPTGQPFPSFSIMRDELQQFIVEDVAMLEQHMSNSYQRRKNILNTNS